MGGQLFTARQTALLKERFAEAGDNSIPGSWLIDGDVDWSKIDVTSAYADLDTRYATVAQGLSADVAFSWGDHALAGYLTAADLPQGYHDSVTAAGGETTLTLSATPTGQVFVIYTPAASGIPTVWRISTDYTIATNVITYVSVTPLLAGDKVDVQYIG